MKQFELAKKNILTRVLSREAFERIARVKAVKPDLALQLELYLVQLYQKGQIKNEITDIQLRQMLDKLTERKDFKIRRI